VENVDKESIKIDREQSTLTFRPKPGKSLDPSAIHAALKPTRLGKSAGSVLSYFREGSLSRGVEKRSAQGSGVAGN
jgi:hypothetical protein